MINTRELVKQQISDRIAAGLPPHVPTEQERDVHQKEIQRFLLSALKENPSLARQYFVKHPLSELKDTVEQYHSTKAHEEYEATQYEDKQEPTQKKTTLSNERHYSSEFAAAVRNKGLTP